MKKQSRIAPKLIEQSKERVWKNVQEKIEDMRWQDFKADFKKGIVKLKDIDLLFGERICLQTYLIEQLSMLCNDILNSCDEHIKPINETLKSEIIELIITYSSAFYDEAIIKLIQERIAHEQYLFEMAGKIKIPKK